MRLSLEMSYEEGTWMARSSAIQGLLVTGDSINDVLKELPFIAQALFEACQEKGWEFVKGAPQTRLGDIVWVIELPQPMLMAA